MLFTAAAAFSLISSLVLAAPATAPAALGKKDYTPVSFTTTFPPDFEAGSSVDLKWTGGSGRYSVYGMLRYPCVDWHPGYFLTNVTDTAYTFTFQDISDYPANSTYTFGVQDALAPGNGAPEYEWYALSQEERIVPPGTRDTSLPDMSAGCSA